MYMPVYCVLFIIYVHHVSGISYSLNISPKEHVTEVDERFLSFTIDPGYLFTRNDQALNKELLCMASALAPAYLRLVGPSTSLMSYYNYTITVNDPNEDFKDSEGHANKGDLVEARPGHLSQFLIITHKQWLSFVKWAQGAGFDLVFGLNNQEKTTTGLWDPNSALSILTIADQANLSNIYWELGYKCQNQTIDDYLNDLETLRVIIETFPSGSSWKVAGGDVTECVQLPGDFRDYYSLATEMVDAIQMNGNASAHHLLSLSEQDRTNLLRLLNFSPRPLWLTESSSYSTELERAADWLASLGVAARNGFTVHYRELREEEITKPTLSFYMSLVYKNLVGSRVLAVDPPAPAAAPAPPAAPEVFAHCTTLRHQVVPGAVTMFAVNMRAEAARYSVRWSRREPAADVLRFILTDHHGNILVNGKDVQNEKDLLPVVKHVRPYKSLLLNLPAKSFGFWVVTNTSIRACQNFDTNRAKNNSTGNDTSESGLTHKKVKRYIDFEDEEEEDIVDIDIYEEKSDHTKINHPALQARIDSINKDLKAVQKIFKSQQNTHPEPFQRKKRQIHEDQRQTERDRIKPRRQGLRALIENLRHNHEEFKPKKLLQNLLQLHKHNAPEDIKHEKGRKIGTRTNKSRVSKRDANHIKQSGEIVQKNKSRKKRSLEEDKPVRFSRHIFQKRRNVDYIEKNEIENDPIEKVKKISDNGAKYSDYLDDENSTELELETPMEHIDEDPIADSSENGLVDTTISRLVAVLKETNQILNRFWEML